MHHRKKHTKIKIHDKKLTERRSMRVCMLVRLWDPGKYFLERMETMQKNM